MKHIVLSGLVTLFSVCIFSQAPEFQRFNYQAVVRDAGILMSNETIEVRFTIRQNSGGGAIEYRETHTVNTDERGLFTAVVGDGNVVQGSILTLGTSTSILYLQVQVDIGSGWVNMGASQIGSVPMANRALYTENDEDDQTLSVVGQNLSISDGNTVAIPSIWSTNGADAYYDSGDIGINTNSPEFNLHVNGEMFVNTSAGRINLGFPSNGNQWRMSTQGSGANLQFQSKPTGSSTYTRRVYLAQNGNVAIGNNSSPDEELVVGTNLGSGWAIPAITVGGTSGGVVQTGNTEYQISMESSSTFGRARIISNSPTGFGRGETEMRTNGLTIGENAGSPGSFMLKVEHGSFGVNFARASTDNDWEFLTSSAAASNLNLYANGA
ncbi:MAG: hypothetical protein HKO93_02910, partial [Flavobacteriales bacterium]|nr:hypothetical protein [Flavobacteriales bacterium]